MNSPTEGIVSLPSGLIHSFLPKSAMWGDNVLRCGLGADIACECNLLQMVVQTQDTVPIQFPSRLNWECQAAVATLRLRGSREEPCCAVLLALQARIFPISWEVGRCTFIEGTHRDGGMRHQRRELSKKFA